MAVDDPRSRLLVEQLLEQIGFKPSALPNLYSLAGGGSRGLGARPPRVPSSMLDAIDDLVKWRQIFPETIDSIVELHSGRPPGASLWGDDATGRSFAIMDMRPHVARMMPDQQSDVLPRWITDVEPAGPQFSQVRFGGMLPSEVFYDPTPEGWSFVDLKEKRDMHPLARRRLVREIEPNVRVMRDLPKKNPHWGDLIAADALRSRLKVELPEVYDQLLVQVGGNPRAVYTAGAPRQSWERERARELTRRIASMYSANPTRHSGWNVNPDLYLRDETGDPSKPSYTPGMSTLEQMKKSEFRPGQKAFLDEAEWLQANREFALDYPKLSDLAGINRGVLSEEEAGLARSARVARNPTNVKIQEILNRNLGRGMRGATTVPFALRGAGSAAVGLLAPLVADRLIKDEAKRNLAQSAIMGGGLGGILGWKGALAGAGIGALASQLFG